MVVMQQWSRIVLTVFSLLGIFAIESTNRESIAAQRGLTVASPTAAKPVELYSASYALVIGIDDYQHWQPLSKAVTDANLVAKELERRGFEVDVKNNLNSDALVHELKTFFAIKGEDPNARLLLWFAGHGHTVDGEGFLVPADAPEAASRGRFKLKALHMRNFDSLVRLANAKHVFAVFDACFAGTIFRSSRGAPSFDITNKTADPVRQFLTSGDEYQEVPDDGRFRKMFLRALRGEEQADANGDNYLTGTELGIYLQSRITNLSEGRVTPQFGKLRDRDGNFDRGDFVFALTKTPNGNASTKGVPKNDQTEMIFWLSIRESEDPNDFKSYLEKFPNGDFAALAHNRLNRMLENRLVRQSKVLKYDRLEKYERVEQILGPVEKRAKLVEKSSQPKGNELTIDGAVAQAVEKLAQHAKDLKTLYVDDIPFETTGIKTDLSRYLRKSIHDELAARFANASNGKKLNIHNLETGGNVSQKDGTYILSGNYWDKEGAIDLRLGLRHLSKGYTVSWSWQFPPPLGVPIRPPGNFPHTLFENDSSGSIKLRLSSERGIAPVYKIDEKFVIQFETDQDAWLYCFYRQANHEWYRIFPNSFHPNPLIKGNQLHRIPDVNDDFYFHITGPPGTELLKCFAANEDVTNKLPERLRRNNFEPLDASLDYQLTKIFQSMTGVGISEASQVIRVQK